MPWKTTDPMSERMKFILLHQSGHWSMSELCAHLGISRKTGYLLLKRYAAEGAAGLQERSRAPLHSPQRISESVQHLLLEARQSHPTWGARKLLAWLQGKHPDLELPAPSTAGDLLRRHGLTRPRKRRRHWRHPGEPAFHAEGPNAVWCADFKGQFRTRDALYCFPLTVSDGHSRFLLACHALTSVRQDGVLPVFERLFREYGLPAAIRTDNGVPFASQAVGGLSKLNVWWIKLGIAHQRIEPGRPEQNGRHERMHRTLKAEATTPAEPTLKAQQKRFDRFRQEYNQERPHEALLQKTPNSHYSPSPRALPQKLPAPEYPSHFLMRKVSNAGTFRFESAQPFLSNALRCEWIGLEENDRDVWSIYFYDVLLCRWDARTLQLRS